NPPRGGLESPPYVGAERFQGSRDPVVFVNRSRVIAGLARLDRPFGYIRRDGLDDRGEGQAGVALDLADLPAQLLRIVVDEVMLDIEHRPGGHPRFASSRDDYALAAAAQQRADGAADSSPTAEHEAE